MNEQAHEVQRELIAAAFDAIPPGETLIGLQLVDGGHPRRPDPFGLREEWHGGTLDVVVETFGPTLKPTPSVLPMSRKRWQLLRHFDAYRLHLLDEQVTVL